MEVLVKKPPVFTVQPEQMYQKKVGETVEMHCEAIGAEDTKKPIIQWQRRDGMSIVRTVQKKIMEKNLFFLVYVSRIQYNNHFVLEKVDLNEVGSKTNKMVKMFGVLLHLFLSPLPSSLSYKVN